MSLAPELVAPDADGLRAAARALREGRLVAFPTETVYGLGAHALDADAVRRVFAVKGRPATSPLIVHVASLEAARALVTTWPDAAERLAQAHWPGPLTLVLPKRDVVPDAVTAGLGTVGLRVPAHPVALALLREAAIPIAAPSANRFTRLSPTRAEHVRDAFSRDEVAMVIEGGVSEVGIESTVVSLAGPEPVLLRPGVLDLPGLSRAFEGGPGAHAAPGQHEAHYQPRTPLSLAGEHLPAGRGAYVWHTTPREAAHTVRLPADARGYAARLYDTLHALDGGDWAWIALEPVPDEASWEGVRDRLRRATARGRVTD